ncbi:hypothetical protein ABBQ32_010065 [Trebouxia sp. C0010 RCD-2024]
MVRTSILTSQRRQHPSPMGSSRPVLSPITELSASPSTYVPQDKNDKGIRAFLTLPQTSRQPDHDQKVQALLKRRQTIKAAGKAQGQQTLQFKQAQIWGD